MSLITPTKNRINAINFWDDESQSSRIGTPSKIDDTLFILSEQRPSGTTNPALYWDGFVASFSFWALAKPEASHTSKSQSGAKLSIVFVEKASKRQDDCTLATPDEMIAAIRSSLSLQVKELAEAMLVQRPTVYSWIKNEVELASVNRVRLQTMYRIAKFWNRLCRLPADGLLRNSFQDGYSVLDLLKRAEVDEDEVKKRLETLAKARIKQQMKVDEERPTSAAILSKYNIVEDDVADQQQIIDAVTGKRAGLEE